MNASESIYVAIEFVSKQVDPGGGGTVTPAAQTGDFTIFAIIAIVLACALAFAMFKISRVYNFGNTCVGNHAKSKNPDRS